MKIAFCSSEVTPFAKTGGMADVCGTLPLALEKLGLEIVITLPGYSWIDRKRYGFTKVRSDVSQGFIGKDIAVYLVEHPGYFDRPGLYGDKHGDYADNLGRFNFYCRRSLELFKELSLKVDLVHCHDWQTALIPVYLKKHFASNPFYRDIRTVLSLHNLAFQGVFPVKEFKELPFSEKEYHEFFEFYGKVNLLKAGILLSDAVSTVSPQYAQEIHTPEFGCGLEGVLLSRKDSTIGILNGLNYEQWDPRRDRYISFNYSPDDAVNKAKNKTVLQKMFKLPERPDVPVFGFVNRFSHQKGIDLIAETMPELMKMDIQLVFLGLGEDKYHKMVTAWAHANPARVAVKIEFSEERAHEVYAGADLFLMPSVYEPCGLSQMISLRYGTVPLVYRTGGLADTVIPHDMDGNGFVFTEYTTEAFAAMVREAVRVYKDRDAFGRIMQKGFAANFSWDESAAQYNGLYHQCLAD